MIDNGKPELLAPAGDASSFLAALAAGADAVYVGLKHFSARAGADNFSLTELSRMVDLAGSEGRRVYIAFNSQVKPGELDSAGRLMLRLARDVHPHALIVQDLGLIAVARQAGYAGELHFSTLANVTHAKAMETAQKAGAARVILPRELSIDEIRQTSANTPAGLDLEMFVHGALCWCVSGRCYWSSYLGGKSGLRGRCVQPCRRIYSQKGKQGGFFSCQDLSLDVLVKTLLDIPNLRSLKIEGRKKGPHYVFHTVSAYRMLLDNMTCPDYPRVKKDAEDLLGMALGRKYTRGLFLPQRVMDVTRPDEPTSSGLLIGKVQFDEESQGRKPEPGRGKPAAKPAAGKKAAVLKMPFFKPRQELLAGDILRIGHEDDAWYATLRISRRYPKAGRYQMQLPAHKTPKAGTPVFLIDRREAELTALLKKWEQKLADSKFVQTRAAEFALKLPPPARPGKAPNIKVYASLPQGSQTRDSRTHLKGLWLTAAAIRNVSRTIVPKFSWWLPPVIWPDEEAGWQRTVNEALRNGAKHFVCNTPWQISLFPVSDKLEIMAGPFCNIANQSAVAALKQLGFSSAVASPELDKKSLLSLPGQSSLPLGFMTQGYWPVGISRYKLNQVKPNEAFFSPKGECFWARNYGQNTWLYSGWPVDLAAYQQELLQAGYVFSVSLDENPPKTLPEARRVSDFNWSNDLL